MFGLLLPLSFSTTPLLPIHQQSTQHTFRSHQIISSICMQTGCSGLVAHHNTILNTLRSRSHRGALITPQKAQQRRRRVMAAASTPSKIFFATGNKKKLEEVGNGQEEWLQASELLRHLAAATTPSALTSDAPARPPATTTTNNTVVSHHPSLDAADSHTSIGCCNPSSRWTAALHSRPC